MATKKIVIKAAETMAKAHQLAAEAVERMKAKEAADKKAAAKAKRDAKKSEAAKHVQLALPWPEAIHALPNAVLRGALFTVSNERETFAKRTLIASIAGLEIRYLGTRLNQTVLDVWEVLLHLQRLQPLGSPVKFFANAMLRELRRGTGGKDHEQLKEEMMLLLSGGVEITWIKDKKTFAGSLISDFFRDEDTGEYIVSFNKQFHTLYAQGYTSFDSQHRQSLGRDNLAKWLHGFYSSHEQPYPYKVETLQRLCGSSVARLGDFRKALRLALDKLVVICAIKNWNIDKKTDLVSVAVSNSSTIGVKK